MSRRLLFAVAFLLFPLPAQAQTSKEIFAQARAAPAGSPEAIELYRRYTTLEPEDAWGFLGLAEAYASARRFGDAETALHRAETLAPGEEDIAIVKQRVERARRNVLPSFRPSAYVARDTDANTSTTFGAAGDAALGPMVRAGIAGGYTSTADGASTATIERGAATLAVKTTRLRWNAEVGGARLVHDRARTVPVGQTQLRWSAGTKSVTADVRVRHAPVTTVYSLVNAETMLTEARALLDVPLFAGLKVRAAGQLGSIETSTLTAIGTPRPGRGNQQQFSALVDRNQRVGFGGGLVLPYSPVSEAALTGYRLQYEDAGSGKYFAPEYVDVLELGTYAEIYRFDPLTIAFDAGVGAQRAKPFGQPEGEVKPSYRLWAQVSLPMARYVDLNGEIDYYKSQLSTVATSAGWSSFAGGISLRWLIN
jgi:hypothetical protein